MKYQKKVEGFQQEKAKKARKEKKRKSVNKRGKGRGDTPRVITQRESEDSTAPPPPN